MIKSEAEFIAAGYWDGREHCKRMTYKFTDCGAWVNFEDWGIVVGSIVEGCDFGTATYPLRYDPGFTMADWYARIEAVEREAADLWRWANEGPTAEQCAELGIEFEDGMTWADTGVDAPDTSDEYGRFEQGSRSA